MASINTPILNGPTRYVENFILFYNSTNSLSVGNGAARENQDQNDIYVGAPGSPAIGSVTVISALKPGVNGIDTGTLAANTFYYVYAMGDSTRNLASCFVISANQYVPNIPIGYDMFRRIGCARTDGSANFLKWSQYGRSAFRNYYFDVPITILTAGAATTFTAVSVAGAVPPVSGGGGGASCEVTFAYTYTQGSTSSRAQFLIGNSGATNGSIIVGGASAGAQQGIFTLPVVGNNILYKVGPTDTLTLSVIGFVDYLSAPQ